jgi:hypothetical protein
MQDVGKTFFLIGILFLVLGLYFSFGNKISFFGNLPGDIKIEKENFRFYFPLTSCILVSVLLSFLFWIFKK